MNKVLKWIIGIVVLAVLAALGTWAFVEGRKELAMEREREAPIKVPPRASRTADGETVITLDGPTQQRIGLKVEPLSALSLPPQMLAYGTLQEDPSQTFTVRSPVAGKLLTSAGGKWPSVGDVLADGAAVGAVEPRFAPVDRVDLASKLASARADVEATTASLVAARAGYERLKTLNGQEANSVSQRALQEAEAQVKGAEARLKAATDTAKLIESAMGAKAGPTGPLPLTVERGGQVIELPANPGESFEAGQAVLKVARFDKLLAAVSVLPGQRIDPSVNAARILVTGFEDHPINGERVAIAPAVNAKTLAQTFLFRISDSALGLRPGMAVAAHLTPPGKARKGVVIPRSAVVRLNGKAWAYVQTADDKFTRREVSTADPTTQGWFVTTGWKEDERVLTAGAQTLLSEELKSQIQVGEEGNK